MAGVGWCAADLTTEGGIGTVSLAVTPGVLPPIIALLTISCFVGFLLTDVAVAVPNLA